MGRLRCSFSELPNLDLEALRALWSKTFPCPPPSGAKRELLIRLLAYGMQERTHGFLSRATQRNLLAYSGGNKKVRKQDSAEQNPSLRLGARLVRSWKGSTHEVTVVERGFAYRGKHYRSLSEIAEAITGAHWSGPRFFGLKKVRSKAAAKDSA